MLANSLSSHSVAASVSRTPVSSRLAFLAEEGVKTGKYEGRFPCFNLGWQSDSCHLECQTLATH